LFQASIVKGERIRPLRVSGSAESHELFFAHGRERAIRSLSILIATELSGWNIIEVL
jgi:hypothetical protein